MANAKLDENSRQTLTALSNANDGTIVDVWADPVTHRLIVDLPTSAGTVTSVSVATANGLAGSVATATTTPAITLTTTITGILQGNGTAISAATTTGSGSVVLATSPTFATGITTPAVLATANDSGALGASGTAFSDLFLASGAVINFNAGNYTLTHSAGLLSTNGNLTLNSTSGVLTLGTIELGAASDTTLSRSASGVLAVEGVVIPSVSSTNTLTNKRITRRVVTTNAPGATPTTNTDNVDLQAFTGVGAAITSMTTNLSGTPVNGDLLEFRFTDDGTARAITWGTSFEATTVALPTTTVISTMLRVGFEWNSTASKWDCIAVA